MLAWHDKLGGAAYEMSLIKNIGRFVQKVQRQVLFSNKLILYGFDLAKKIQYRAENLGSS